MTRLPRFFSHVLLIVFLLPAFCFNQGDPRFDGQWTLIPEKSSEIGLYSTLSLDIQQKGTTVILTQKWGTSRSFEEKLVLETGGKSNRVPVTNRVFPTNVFMGLSQPVGDSREIIARWEENGSVLKLEERSHIRASQGRAPLLTIHVFELSADKERLIYTVKRSTRKTGPPVRFVLKRAGTRNAYFMELEDNWEIDGLLPEQAFLISLQGVANIGGPRLYFIYPETWAFTYTPTVFEFYKEKKDFTFRQLRTPEQALNALKEHVRGYVVWDKSVRTSLIVAFTVAGLERAVVVSEDLILWLREPDSSRSKISGENSQGRLTLKYTPGPITSTGKDATESSSSGWEASMVRS